jgi:DNA-binding response OmpR family regulator
MSVNPESGILYDFSQARMAHGRAVSHHPTVLLVEDQDEVRRDLKQIMVMNGYLLIDTDNGRDAVKRARNAHPDLLIVDLDVPLLYGLVAARQIIKQAELEPLPVVIVTHEETVDPYPMMEMGVRRNEYVTRLDDYEQLGNLLNYLLPIRPEAA